jgi:hypothetical protein
VQQADALAGSAGPLIAGVLIKIMGAPLAVLVDALTYLMSGLLLASVKAPDPVPDRDARRSLGNELREGLAWVYRHRTLASIALTSHAIVLRTGRFWPPRQGEAGKGGGQPKQVGHVRLMTWARVRGWLCWGARTWRSRKARSSGWGSCTWWPNWMPWGAPSICAVPRQHCAS